MKPQHVRWGQAFYSWYKYSAKKRRMTTTARIRALRKLTWRLGK